MPVATFSGGNSSRMIPKASGKTAPPTPWITRPAISMPIECDSAATIDPVPKVTRVATSIRDLPKMSPSRPTIGVATEAESR